MKNFNNLIYFLASTVLRLFFKFFYRLKIYGSLDNLPAKAVVAANHTSYFDPPLLTVLFKNQIHFMARSSLFRFPIFSWIIRKLNAHPVDRDGADLGAIKTICHIIEQNNRVILFPEGTRSSNGELGKIKGGFALIMERTHCDLIPIYIHGAYEAWSRSKKIPKLFGKIECVIGEPILWEHFSHLSKKELQHELTLELTKRLNDLKIWLCSGTKGPIPTYTSSLGNEQC